MNKEKICASNVIPNIAMMIARIVTLVKMKRKRLLLKQVSLTPSDSFLIANPQNRSLFSHLQHVINEGIFNDSASLHIFDRI